MHIALIMAILWFGIWIPEFLVRFSRAYINTVDAFDHIVDYEVVAEFSVDREDIDRDVYFKLVSVKPKFQIYFGILLLMIFSYAYMTNIFADRNIFVVTLSLFMIIPSLGALALRLITVKHDSGVVLIRTFESKSALLRTMPRRAIAFGCLNLFIFFALFVIAARVGNSVYGN